MPLTAHDRGPGITYLVVGTRPDGSREREAARGQAGQVKGTTHAD